ncbi:hypothetical protein CI109_102252 [Kwoniella shandongensis]|uniref:Uncharacterized protein n=1 Tax=Kwoniella shandongensis TaxID=1734106 RepID=A0A5M6C0A5_9TREE|nr:uncharacterized protein CI109_003594 [Kwoniella shandongensis]KAA5527940.1 hypothetical protein CI109_003594 [Kwoniella shandongensis]
MQAPQLRLNERQANPNPYVIFIRSLRTKKDHTDAEDILKAVAAQMKTIMRDRFMQVHTLEEAAFNRVFAGRNWNHGQSIELVLRGPTGRFLPMAYIISVMCHEMAHIEQMNHGPKFQKLMAEIKADVSRLQAKGYYGDGFWSDGKRLADSVRMGGEGLRQSDFPEYVCGVSAADARKARRPNRGPSASQGPGLVKGEASHRSGRQTEYNRKAGRRNNADMGEVGLRLDGGKLITKEDREARKAYMDDRTQLLLSHGVAITKAKKRAAEMFDEENPWWKEGSTRGRTAKSKTAAEMRAAAAEARLRALAGPSNAGHSDLKPIKSDDEASDEESADEGEEEVPDPHMNVEERRKEMEEEMDDEEREGLRGGWEEYVGDGLVKSEEGQTGNGERSGKRVASPPVDTTKGKQRKVDIASAPKFGADLVREERLRGLGLATTGSTKSSNLLGGRAQDDRKTGVKLEPGQSNLVHGEKDLQPREDGKPGWRCRVCTFINLIDQGRCEMCQSRPDGTMPPDVII